MNLALALSFSKVTEAAALAAFPWIGKGDKNQSDDAAVKAMRAQLNQIEMRGEIVIGEGEIDEAPMLYIGEEVGSGRGEKIEIAVDPIDGTRMTAMGQSNSIAVLAAGEQYAFLRAPDMYMEKLVIGAKAKGAIDLTLPLEENLHRIAQALGKTLTELRVMILAKPRHDSIIAQLHALGVSVLAIPDGDVAGSIQCCLPDAQADVLYGIGGAPEGVAAAAAINALGGDMQARLIPRNLVKGNSLENQQIAEDEIRRCHALNVDVNHVLHLTDLVRSNHTVFVATGITQGDLVQGVTQRNGRFETETLVIDGSSRTFRTIKTIHF